MLLALALLAVPTPGGVLPAGRAVELDRLVLECDRVVRARVTLVHQIPRGFQLREGSEEEWSFEDPDLELLEGPKVRVLELRVEETYWGPPEERSLFVLDDAHYPDLRMHGSPEKGEESIWFLEFDPWFEKLAPLQKERISKLAGTTGLQIAAMGGFGRLRLEQREEKPVVCLHATTWIMPSSLTSVGSHSTTKPEGEWLQVAQPAFEDWLRRCVAASVPSIEVTVHSNGPGGISVTIDRLGHAQRSGTKQNDKVLEVGPEVVKAILEMAEQEKFFGLPLQLGSSAYPDSASYWLRIRTNAGSRCIRLHGPPNPKSDSSALLDAHARAMRVWDAIPLAREWKIDGH